MDGGWEEEGGVGWEDFVWGGGGGVLGIILGMCWKVWWD